MSSDPSSPRFIGDIKTSRGNIRSILHHVRDARSRGPLKVLALEHLGDILENAVLFDERMDGKDYFYNLAHRMSFEGVPYIARVIVKKDRNGNLTYDVEFSRKEKLSNAPASGTGASANAETNPAHSTTGSILQGVYTGNPGNEDSSKIVDENGEPLVVWHGTRDADFTVFDSRYATTADGFIWTTADRATAEEYAIADPAYGETSRLLPLFVNARNPIVLNAGGRRFLDIEGEIEDAARKVDAGNADGIVVNDIIDPRFAGSTLGPTSTFAVKKPNQVKSATDNSGAFDGANPDIRFSVAGIYTYNPRSNIPNVRGGWNEKKILRYLKANPSLHGVRTAARLISEFDTVDELKDHMFYHGTRNYIDKMQPSMTQSERWAQEHGGGGYGQRYWGISVSKSKKVASIFGNPSPGVSIYPVVLAKGAKVIDRPDLTDAADVEDNIVELWNDGVDAVRLGDWKSDYSEQELLVLNPRAICNIGTADSYRYFGLGSDENPLDIKDDAHIARMLEAAKEYAEYSPSKRFGKPLRPSLFYPRGEDGALGEMKPREVIKAEKAQYEKDLAAWQQSEQGIAAAEYEWKMRDTIRYSVSPAEDAAYMDAVRRGDMDTAARMVREAAARAGYTIEGWHGSDHAFTVFDKTRLGEKTGAASAMRGFFFTNSKATAESYIVGSDQHFANIKFLQRVEGDARSAKREILARIPPVISGRKTATEVAKAIHDRDIIEKTIITQAVLEDEINRAVVMAKERGIKMPELTDDSFGIYDRIYDRLFDALAVEEGEAAKRRQNERLRRFFLKIENPLVHDFKGEEYRDESYDTLLRQARRRVKGEKLHDGAIFKNTFDGMFGGDTKPHDIYVVFANTQAKSADPVTYDDAGNVIPLSQRFNPKSDDIRFSVAVNPRLREDVEAALVTHSKGGGNAKPLSRRQDVVMSENLPLFGAIGLPDMKVICDPAHLRKINGEHLLTLEQIVELPARYNDPAVVFKDGEKAFVVITDMVAPNKAGVEKSVMVRLSEQTKKSGERLFLASAYSREAEKESEYTRLVNTPGAPVYFNENKVAALVLEQGTKSTLQSLASRDDVVAPEGMTGGIVPPSGAVSQERFSVVERASVKRGPDRSREYLAAYLAAKILAGAKPDGKKRVRVY